MPGAKNQAARKSGAAVTDPVKVAEGALDTAKHKGASYADVRIVRMRRREVGTREDHVTGVSSSEEYGLGVRVIKNGAWGFAATAQVNGADADRAVARALALAEADARSVRKPVVLAPVPAYRDVWQTPVIKDPFKVPLGAVVDLLLAVNAEALKVAGARYVSSSFEAQQEWKLFASSEGSRIEQQITRVGPQITVTAVDAQSGDFVTRAHDISGMPRQAGFEFIENARLVDDARQVAEEAVEKLKAPSVIPGARTLILDPSHLWLTIHESVGHPTELDRALGYEANFAGTSFATPEKLGQLRFAAPGLTFYADRITPGGLATCGYDDDGVRTGRWDLVRNGLFVGYQTTREQAGWIGEKESRGCSYGEGFAGIPFQRMPNVSLMPGPKDLSTDDVIAATDDGIYIQGNDSYSIDHQRFNFQFSGKFFWEVKRGKKTRALRDVGYQSNTVEFWNSCDLLGGRKSWAMGGSLHDGKGEPMQSNPVSHGTPTARFAKVNVINTNTRRSS